MKFREQVRRVIFEAETPAGRFFDLSLLTVIVVSTLCVVLESVDSIARNYSDLLITLEWVFTAIYSVEYLARLYASPRPLRYVVSFYGLIDLISIIPTYASLLFSGAPSFIVIRSLRLLRTFRVLKLVHFVGEADVLRAALQASQRKILVFIWAIICAVTLIGSLMYFVEGGENGFTSIPSSIYWAIVTLTTVGYGDIAPVTVLGKTIASMVMVLGYGIIAVPTGIVTAEISQASRRNTANTTTCAACFLEGHHAEANYCRRCGFQLHSTKT